MTIHPTFLQPGVPQYEPVEGKTYRADGWALLDMPWGLEEWYHELEALAVDGGWIYLDQQHHPHRDGPAMRALVITNPETTERVIAFLLARREARGEKEIVH